jgi:cupin 2 domain-containing protein
MARKGTRPGRARKSAAQKPQHWRASLAYASRMLSGNVLSELPEAIDAEVSQLLLERRRARFERIVSRGQSSPEGFWYDQSQHEFVLVVAGRALLEFDSGETKQLEAGDWIQIDAHARHRVAWTDPNVATVWLVAFFDA